MASALTPQRLHAPATASWNANSPTAGTQHNEFPDTKQTAERTRERTYFPRTPHMNSSSAIAEPVSARNPSRRPSVAAAAAAAVALTTHSHEQSPTPTAKPASNLVPPPALALTPASKLDAHHGSHDATHAIPTVLLVSAAPTPVASHAVGTLQHSGVEQAGPQQSADQQMGRSDSPPTTVSSRSSIRSTSAVHNSRAAEQPLQRQAGDGTGAVMPVVAPSLNLNALHSATSSQLQNLSKEELIIQVSSYSACHAVSICGRSMRVYRPISY